MKVTYEKAKEDHRVLWAIAPARDMTGGYEDQKDLALLLDKPNKNTARKCLVDQINYWFQRGTDDCQDVDQLVRENPHIASIRRFYDA